MWTALTSVLLFVTISQATDPCENVTCGEGLVCKVFTLTSSTHTVSRCVDPYTPTRCQLPMDTGPCKAFKTRWFYNTETGICDSMQFGGCEGNQNRYDTETQCRLMCIPEIEPEGHVQCSLAACHMACQFGFAKDSRGCDLCQCAIPPEPFQNPCAEEPLCALYCMHGYQKDEHGCTVCKCRDHPPCLDVECLMECQFGFSKGRDGCPLCECAANPCNVITCPDDEECIPKRQEGGFWEPTCTALHESKPWCLGKPACMSHCEHGHQADQYGCDTCLCLDGPPECVRMSCVQECEYGNMYDSLGCMTCSCHADPCKNETCKDEGLDVCEATHPHENCKTCPAKDRCMFSRNVRQVRINFLYAHDSFDDHISMNELGEYLKVQVLEVLEIDDDYVKAFRVTRVNDNAVLVEYYIITFGNTDLVDVTEEFISDLDDQELHVTYKEVKFVPQQHTLTYRYYSAHSYPDEEIFDGIDDVDDDVMQTVIIIASCAAGIVAILVIVAVCFAVTRSKNKQNKGRHNPRHIYNQVPANVDTNDDKKKPPPPEKVVEA